MSNIPKDNPVGKSGGRAILWMIPRSISTAFTKCMSGIPGCEVWMEPFFFCHFALNELEKLGIKGKPMSYDGHEELFKTAAEALEKYMPGVTCFPDRLPFATVKKDLEDSISKYVFVKDESIAMQTDQRRQFIPEGYQHAFLIRHPLLVYKSMRKGSFVQFLEAGMLKFNETDESSFDFRPYAKEHGVDIVFEQHHKQWTYIRDHVNPSPLVIDSSALLTNPAPVLREFCEAVGFPYSESLLQWSGSPEVAKEWKWPGENMYKDENYLGAAKNSTHFTPPAAVPAWEEVTDDVRELAEKAMPYYEDMIQRRPVETSS
ncbi:uncharacterized protein [Diadema antillarum]|uniref:uncharacterized protein isoform X1 n=1 Tax=Diadema antillarum TaxID=105358 RepID=UPI003A88C430